MEGRLGRPEIPQTHQQAVLLIDRVGFGKDPFGNHVLNDWWFLDLLGHLSFEELQRG